MRKAAFLFVAMLSLVSCREGKVSVLLDPWWEGAYDPQGTLRRTVLLRNLTSFGKIGIIEADSWEAASEFLRMPDGSERSETFIVTPVFYSYLRKNPVPEKNNNYIILNGFYDDAADNVIAVYSSRVEVYHSAGVKAASYSRDNGGRNVSAVFYSGSETRRLEMDSFVRGFESVEGRGELYSHIQPSYSAGDRLMNYIQSAPERDICLFFFSASSLNPYCIEQAVPLAIPLSGENLNGLGIYNELIEFSVDDDIMEIVDTALQIGLDGEIENDIPVFPLIRERGIHF